MLIEEFYKILKTDQTEENELVFTIQLNKEHPIYIGHFPDSPITPGVCIIQVLKNIISEKFGKSFLFGKIGSVKFLNIIDPLENSEIQYVIKYSINEGDVEVNVIVKNDMKVFTKISGTLVRNSL